MDSHSRNLGDIFRIPPPSPSRRDYSLRSCTPKDSNTETSRPQSPWSPCDLQLPSREVNRFSLYESNPPALNRSTYYSGPLSTPPKGTDRSYYSGPLPSPSPLPSYFNSPLPGLSTTTTEAFEFLTGARTHFRWSFSDGSESPEVEFNREISFREDKAEACDPVEGNDDTASLEDGPCPLNSSPSVSNIGEGSEKQIPNGRDHDYVRHEFGIADEVAQHKADMGRASQICELTELNTHTDEIYDLQHVARNEDKDSKAAGVTIDRKHKPFGSIAWDILDDDKNEIAISHLAMVTVPFKWEKTPGKVHSRNSSTSTESYVNEIKVKDSSVAFSFGRDRGFYGGIEKGSEKASNKPLNEEVGASDVNLVAPAMNVLESSTPPPKPIPQKALRSAVPFKWEKEPGKAKFEDRAIPEAVSALSLPPRLVSAAVKRNSSSASATSTKSRSKSITSGIRVRPANRKSANATEADSCRQSQGESLSPPSTPLGVLSRLTLSTTFSSGPLDGKARPSHASGRISLVSKSGPITQFGTPQYESEEFYCEGRLNSVRSPTSTLSGPDSVPSCNFDKRSHKYQSVTCSHSSSGVSAELLEYWSYVTLPSSSSPSRHPSNDSESRASPQMVSVEDRDDVKTSNNGTLIKLRRKSHTQLASSKPPMSPIRSSQTAPASPSRTEEVNGYSSHYEEFFNGKGSGSSSTSPSELEDELPCAQEEVLIDLEPPTRLPYTIPSPLAQCVVVESEPLSPTPVASKSSACLSKLRFKSGRGSNTTPCLWVQNCSYNAKTRSIGDSYKSPAYKATLELLSPLPNQSKKAESHQSRTVNVRSGSSRRRRVRIVVCIYALSSFSCNHLYSSSSAGVFKKGNVHTMSFRLNIFGTIPFMLTGDSMQVSETSPSEVYTVQLWKDTDPLLSLTVCSRRYLFSTLQSLSKLHPTMIQILDHLNFFGSKMPRSQSSQI